MLWCHTHSSLLLLSGNSFVLINCVAFMQREALFTALIELKNDGETNQKVLDEIRKVQLCLHWSQWQDFFLQSCMILTNWVRVLLVVLISSQPFFSWIPWTGQFLISSEHSRNSSGSISSSLQLILTLCSHCAGIQPPDGQPCGNHDDQWVPSSSNCQVKRC